MSSLRCQLLIARSDLQVLRTYQAAPYAAQLSKLSGDLDKLLKSVTEKIGVVESDTGLAPPHLWDIAADRFVPKHRPSLAMAMFRYVLTRP